MNNLDFVLMLLKIIVFLPFILFLIYLSLKFGGSKLQSIQNGRYIKILERVSLSKENSLLVVKIGDKGYVLTSVAGKVDTLLELKEAEIKKIEESKQIQEYANLKEFYQKLFKKKEE
ncbi:flagellar biosynthetic protein FliO [Clostridium sp. SYSU_GA19001]|uniref:flagellar biosynthetic protein FliO n=1 Tax=Clostridium caldaquaticum TaxID=2940653 RepID=UPI0020778435|nr:flagellar biosynthetic protein FliO [Clostridium caldaquaticum]MCM8710980.1 flagellar biosynthetic protein FliO [Clostridium caldaquaticum]